jgi:hypothetical protein
VRQATSRRGLEDVTSEILPAVKDLLSRRADGNKLRIQPPAAEIGWERSRASHHIRRMAARGLVTSALGSSSRDCHTSASIY